MKISQKLLNKSGRQYASVKLNTGTGWNIFSTGRPIKVTLRDGQGRYICSWTAKGGDKIRLGERELSLDEADEVAAAAGGNTLLPEAEEDSLE